MKHYTTTQQGATFEVFCTYANTRNGFKHEVELQKNGFRIAFAKRCYLNRTWERFEYESAINAAIDKAQLAPDKRENEKRREALKRQFFKKALPGYTY